MSTKPDEKARWPDVATFARKFYGIELDPWQVEAIQAMSTEERAKAVARAAARMKLSNAVRDDEEG